MTENAPRGTAVLLNMRALDYDDPHEGNNARITYSIEQNQVSNDLSASPLENPEHRLAQGTLAVTMCPQCCNQKSPMISYSGLVGQSDRDNLRNSLLQPFSVRLQ